MAHPCFSCGSECYCHGDIDDVIVSHTPSNCDGCGCEAMGGDYLDEFDDADDEDDKDLSDTDFCPECSIGLNNNEKSLGFCQNCKAHWDVS